MDRKVLVFFLAAFLFSVFVVFVILSISPLLLFGSSTSNGEVISQSDSKLKRGSYFQHTEIDLSKNKVSYSLSKVNSQSSEFLSYRNEETGNMHFLTPLPFGSQTKEFECTGTCVCVSPSSSSRRSLSSAASSPLLKTFTLVLSAISSSVALSMSKKAFKEECAKHFYDEEACELFDALEEHGRCDPLARDELPITIEYSYYCYGFCVPYEPRDHILDGKYLNKPAVSEKWAKTGKKCKDLHITGYMISKNKIVNDARLNFIIRKLNPYCRYNSQVNFYDVSQLPPKSKVGIPACMGMAQEMFPRDVIDQKLELQNNVHCTFIEEKVFDGYEQKVKI